MWDTGMLRGVRVLFVEDDDDTRGAVALGLQILGAEVTPVSSVDQALDALASKRHDVIVTDVCLPGKDAYDLIRAVRSRADRIARIPAAVVTAFGGREDREKALHAGFQEHLTKPVDTGRLASVVAWLAREAAARGVPTAPEPGAIA
jgi:hypothetical protein